MNRNEWIGVVVSIGFITYIFAGGMIMNIFNPQTAVNTQTGVQAEDLVLGQGDSATAGDALVVHYVGTLESGKVFDSSIDRGQPITFN